MSLPVANPSAIYAFDKASAEFCTQMQVDGFAFDGTRALEVSAFLRGEESSCVQRMSQALGRPIKLGKTKGLSTNDLLQAFFVDLRAPIYFRSELTRKPSLCEDALRAYAMCADDRLVQLALETLRFRSVRMTRARYVDGVTVGGDGRIHPTWMNYGTVSGRFSCQKPNLQNNPRIENDPASSLGGIRALYHAPPGYQLVYFDFSQLEMRIAAYATGDPKMIQACESSDMHAYNASEVFGREAFDLETYTRLKGTTKGDLTPEDQVLMGRFSALRSRAKEVGFAICYMAKASTVQTRLSQKGEMVMLRQVEALLRKIRRTFRHYYTIQDQWLAETARTGYIYTPILGRRRWLGPDPSPTESANFPIQGGAADVVNTKTLEIRRRLPQVSPRAMIVAQVHDSVTIQTPESDTDRVRELCREVCESPVKISSSGSTYEAIFPIDLEVINKWK